jgi:uncharacterized membrane protein
MIYLYYYRILVLRHIYIKIPLMQKTNTSTTVAIATIMAALALVAAIGSTVSAQAIQPSADEKADSQADKGHIDQADNFCQKAGYDGYINNDCGYLN